MALDPKFQLTPQLRAYALAMVKRVLRPALAVASVFAAGVVGFYILGGGRWSLLETAYFATITMTTVGYGDTLRVHDDPTTEIFTIIFIWVGLLTTLYAISSITAFIIEQHMGRFFKERKMLSKIAALRGHYIICGAGTTGEHIIREFHETKRPFLTIDTSTERLEYLRTRMPDMLYLVTDALDETALEQAGLDRAAGVFCALQDDSQNMLLTVVCATAGNKKLRIVSKCIDYDLVDKFRRAGAVSVVSPNFIGGLRMASEMMRPHVVGFLDKMMRHPDAPRVEEVTIASQSRLVGATLAESRILEKTGLQVVAISNDGGSTYEFNPPAERTLGAGDVCIVIGEVPRIARLREMVE